MNFLKKSKKALACLLSMAMLAGMSTFAVSVNADEASPRFEAEDGVLVGAAQIVTTPTAGADVSNGAFVGSLGQNDGFVEITVVSDEAGEREVIFAYCSWEARSLDVSVNGGDYVNIPTRGNGTNWNGDCYTETVKLWLNAGENVLKIGCVNGWAPNVDYVELGILEADAIRAAVEELVNSAEALPETVDNSNVADFDVVVSRYEGLTEDQKAMMTEDQVAIMDAVVAKVDAFYAEAEQLEADRAAAGEVTELINAIDSAEDKKAAVEAARAAYDALTESQKACVMPGTYNKLVEEESKLNGTGSTGTPSTTPSGSGDSTTTPSTTTAAPSTSGSDTDSDADASSDSTVIIVVVVAVVVVAAAAILIVVLGKKKKAQ